MAKVKIILDRDEKIEEVESDLFKALNLHASGDVHDGESFKDHAMNAVAHKMKATHARIYGEMIDEIVKTLDKDYRK